MGVGAECILGGLKKSLTEGGMGKDGFGKLLRGSAELDGESILSNKFGSVPSNDSQVVGFAHGRTIATCCMLAKPKIYPTKLLLCHG